MQPDVVPPAIYLQARPEELPFIDEAICDYIKLLQLVAQPSTEREEIISQLRSFRQRYLPLLVAISGPRQCSMRQKWRARSGSPQLLSWHATSCELIAFGCAVI